MPVKVVIISIRMAKLGHIIICLYHTYVVECSKESIIHKDFRS